METATPGPAFALAPGIARRPAWRLRLCYEYVALYFLLAVFAVSSLIWSLAATILYPLLPRRLGETVGQFMLMAGCRYFIGVMQWTGIIDCDLTSLDALRGVPSLVITPNHPSLLDAILIISRLPRVACTAKAKLLRNLLLGGSARLAGFIRNDAPLRLVREGVRQLQAGRQLLIFPEGSRTGGGEIDPFKGGFALIAKRAGAAVQTVFIESNSRFLGKGWSLLKKPDFPVVYRVRLGPALVIDGEPRDFVAGLHEYYRDELRRAK